MKSFNTAAFASVLLGVFLFSLSSIRLDDVFMYLTFARRLFTLGEFGEVDPYLYTITGYHWHVWHEWFSYVVYYGAHLLGGYKGIVVLRGILVTAATLIVLRACTRAFLPPLVSVVMAIAAVYAASPRLFRDRSSIFSDLLTLLLLYLITDRGFTSKHSKWKWLLPGLFLLWVQLHPAYAIGWFVLGLFVVCSWSGWDYGQRREWKSILIACWLVTFLNPLGYEGVRWPIEKFLSPDWAFFKAVNHEWMPTLEAHYLEAPYKVFITVLAALAVILSFRQIRRSGLFLFSAAVFVTYLTFSASRFLALGGLSLVVILVSSLSHHQWPSWLQAKRVTAAAFFAATVFVMSLTLVESRGLPFLLYGDPLHPVVPKAAVDFIRTLPPGNIFNDWEIGVYLAWELDGRQKIAAHGFISDTKLAEQNYFRFSYAPKDWREVVVGNQSKYFFLRRQTYEEHRAQNSGWISELTGPDWKKIYIDRAAVIFEYTR